jgi:hypothetical protein
MPLKYDVQELQCLRKKLMLKKKVHLLAKLMLSKKLLYKTPFENTRWLYSVSVLLRRRWKKIGYGIGKVRSKQDYDHVLIVPLAMC